MRFLTLCLLCFSLNSANAEGLKIVAFGDSTTAYRGTIKQVYSDRLPALLKEIDIDATVINAGVGGSNTGNQGKHALARIGTIRKHQADWVVVQFGINDCWVDSGKPDGPSRISVDDFRENLVEIIHTLRHDGSRVILMTPNQLRSEVPAWRKERFRQYVAVVRDVAHDWRVPLADIWQAYADLPTKERRSPIGRSPSR